MSTNDYSFCQEERTTLSGGSLPPNTNNDSNNDEIPSAVLDPSQREDTVMTKLGELMDLLKGNAERGGGINTASYTVELERLSERIEELAKDQDKIKASITDLQENLVATMQEILNAEQKNADHDDPCNQDASAAAETYTIPPQSPILWKGSKGRTCNFDTSGYGDILDCPPLLFGKRYKWSMKVCIAACYFELGVSAHPLTSDLGCSLGYEAGGWSYTSGGEAHHAEEIVLFNLPKYQAGSKLTFILDLTGNGSLSVYRDDDATNLIELFVNMKSEKSGISPFAPAAFIPAATGQGKVEFLGFEDH